MTSLPVTEFSCLAHLMDTARHTEAANSARNLLDRHPSLGFLWKVYGVALMRQAKDARPVLHKATQLLPHDPDTYYYLGTALEARGELSSALVSYHRALQLRPDFTEVIVNLANALRDSGRPEEAVVRYIRALQRVRQKTAVAVRERPGQVRAAHHVGHACTGCGGEGVA